MKATEKTFRHSFGKLAMMALSVLIAGFAIFFIDETNYFLLVLIGFAFIAFLFYATSSVKISESEIVTTRFLGTKSLPWSDISHVSMRGQAIRLHNRDDDDVVLSIDSQLEGYPEILDIIFKKRPDLFDVGGNDMMSRGLLSGIATVGVGLAVIAISAFIFFAAREMEEVSTISALIFLALGLFIIASWFLAPQSILLEDQTMVVAYLFREVTYTAGDITSVALEKRRTRNGYVYFVQVNLKTGKPLKLSGFWLGSVLMYQILKRWHDKASSSQRFTHS